MLGSQKDPNDGFDEASSLAGNTYLQYSPLASSSFTTCDDRDGDDNEMDLLRHCYLDWLMKQVQGTSSQLVLYHDDCDDGDDCDALDDADMATLKLPE